MTRILHALVALSVSTAVSNGQAVFESGAVAGQVHTHLVQSGETLTSIEARYGVDWEVIARDNDLDSPGLLRAGQTLEVDNRHIAPAPPLESGIVINVPQRMLFHFENGQLARSFPVALGRVDWRTPVGSFEIVARDRDPTWVVPAAIQEEMRLEGRPVVERVPPGPANPLGAYRLRLDEPGYSIHGTNDPAAIYGFPSHGCIRMGPTDIAELFPLVEIGTPVRIIYEPVLAAILPDGSAFLEVHPDIYGEAGDPLEAATRLIREGGFTVIEPAIVEAIVEEAAGIARRLPVGPAPIP